MCNLESVFGTNKALISYFTCGDPNSELTKKAALAAVQAGADVIALGVPFSDPTAVDPVIQESNIRALANGATPAMVFSVAAGLCETVPVVLFTYANVVYSIGVENFAKKCRDNGVSGVVIHDVPLEERGAFSQVFESYRVCVISTVSPSVPERIAQIAVQAKGFLYVITDAKTTQAQLQNAVEIIKLHTAIPCVVGCGVADSAPIEDFCRYADGAVLDYELVYIMGSGASQDAVAQYIGKIDKLLNA